jgi:hypothetical protein
LLKVALNTITLNYVHVVVFMCSVIWGLVFFLLIFGLINGYLCFNFCFIIW